MEATQAEGKPIPKLKFKPVNELLLCREIELPEEHHGIVLPESSKDHWGKQAEIIVASDKMMNHLNDYKVGDVILFPRALNVLSIWIEDEPYIILAKRDVVAIVK